MNRLSLSLKSIAAIGLLVVAACGPIIVPMGHRLTPDQQQVVDQSWQRALAADEELGRQGWLDLMVSSFAFEYGVDRFHFTSEKQVDDRLVTMEIWFDREKPDADAFEVTVFDAERKILRKERYNRAEVEESITAMYPQGQPADGIVTDEWKKEEARRVARRARVQKIFPEPKRSDWLDVGDPPADALAPANRR